MRAAALALVLILFGGEAHAAFAWTIPTPVAHVTSSATAKFSGTIPSGAKLDVECVAGGNGY